MPIQAKSNSKKRFYKKKPFTMSQYKALRRLVPIEKRFHDTSLAGQTISNVGTTLSLTPNSIARDGNQITVVGLHGKYHINAADNYNYVRVVIFRWKADTSPATSSVLDSVAMAANRGGTANYNISNAGLFSVLYDRTHYVDADDPGTRVISYNLKKKIGRRKVIYDGDAASATAGQYKLYMCMVSDSGAVSHPYINADNRVTYLDA